MRDFVTFLFACSRLRCIISREYQDTQLIHLVCMSVYNKFGNYYLFFGLNRIYTFIYLVLLIFLYCYLIVIIIGMLYL